MARSGCIENVKSFEKKAALLDLCFKKVILAAEWRIDFMGQERRKGVDVGYHSCIPGKK